MQAAVLTACDHVNQLSTPEGLVKVSRAAEFIFSTFHRPVLNIGNDNVPKCMHPDCRYPLSYNVHACIHCIHIACLSSLSTRIPSLDNNHVAHHYKSSGHAVFLSVEHSKLFCAACNDFVYCRYLDAALEMQLNLAQNFRRNFSSSLSPLDGPFQIGADNVHNFMQRRRNKKRRLATRSAWTCSKAELDQISAHSVPIPPASRGVHPPVGLYNLGNSCYMNSVLQALVNAPPFRNYFLSGRHKLTCTKTLKLECFACALDQVVCDSYSHVGNQSKNNCSSLQVPFLVPNNVLDIVWRNVFQLATYTQHDAHEFLIEALNLLNTHCRIINSSAPLKDTKVGSAVSPPVVGAGSTPTSKNKDDNSRKLSPVSPVQNLRVDPGGASLGADILASRTSSIVQNLFSGILQSDVVCRACGNSSPTLERFYDISLDVDKVTKPASTRRSRAPSPAVEVGNEDQTSGLQASSRPITLSISQNEKLRMNGDEKIGSLEGSRGFEDSFGSIMDGQIDKEVDMANSLYECLARFTEPELLGSSSKMHCVKCKRKQEAMKQMSVRTLPPILCFHFKRFEQSYTSVRRTEMVKIDTPVEFPANGLDVTRFLTSAVLQERKNTMQPAGGTTVETGVGGSAERKDGKKGNGGVLREKQECLYDLFAIVNHMGKIDSGHYTAMIRKQGQWFRCDDEEVSSVDKMDRVIRSEEAYLVFYVQRHPNFQF